MAEDKWWQKDSSIPIELNDVPIMVNNTNNVKNSEFIELHKKIDALVCEFMKEHDLPNAWCIGYGIDDLQNLKKYGIECPSCDGSLGIYDIDRNDILLSM